MYEVRKPINKGQRLDLLDLLSNEDRDYLVCNNGDKVKVNTLKGKYVILCCFDLPLTINYGLSCRELKASLSEWNNTRDDIVLVLVVDNVDNENIENFHDFISGFPSCTLAIPFWDSDSRGFFSKYLKVNNYPYGVVIGPNLRVLRDNTNFIRKYGSNSYPFTGKRFRTLRQEARGIKKRRPVLLEELLQLRSYDFLMSENGDRVSVSVLKTKLVGLYLSYYPESYIMRTLIELYKRCIALGLELEIVLVYNDNVDNFVERINLALQEKGISSWWVLPYKETVSRRLWQLCKSVPKDVFIVVGPNGKFLDTEADCFLGDFDIDIDAFYPFAFEAIVEQETSRRKAVTLESLLVDSRSEERHNCILNRHGVPVPIATLSGKNVLLCLAFSDDFFREDGLFDMVFKWLHKDRIRNSNTRLELVFVLFNTPMPILPCPSRKRKRNYNQNSWLTYTPASDHQAFMIQQLFAKGTDLIDIRDTIIAFGEDGRILTTNVIDHISKDITRVSRASIPFSDTLHRDVAAEYTSILNLLHVY